MKRDEHVNDIPDIEIVDLENETVQDTDFGKSDISDDFEGNPDDEYEEKNEEEEKKENNGVGGGGKAGCFRTGIGADGCNAIFKSGRRN